MKKLLLIGFVLALLAAAQLKRMVYEPGGLSDETVVMVNRGAGSGAVAARLAEAEVIRYPWLFRIAARLQGLDKHLKAGEYRFLPGISMAQVLSQMTKGEVLYRRLTLPEGLTTAQMLEIINDNPYLNGEISLAPKEGTLLPETYSFLRGDSRDSIIRHAEDAMRKVLDETWKGRDKSVPVKNAGELLILASIIEKETGVSEERGLVASVFANRLRKGMRLQTDPTVIYALTGGKTELGRPLTRRDLELDNPYNTYRYYGLPPSPICNPGKASLHAAAHPELTDYLYFVASGNGGHNFAASLDQHNRNVGNWKRRRKNQRQ